MFTFKADQWIPGFILNDKNGYALAMAIEAAMQSMNDTVLAGLECLTDTDKMPEWRLDEVAWENGIVYDYSADVETKRAAIKNGYDIYHRLGTKLSMMRMISTAFRSSELSEWFEYEGDPYHYKVTVDVTDDPIDEERHTKLAETLAVCQPLRSTLDELAYFIRKGDFARLCLFSGVGLKAANTVTIDCETPVLGAGAMLTNESGVYLTDEDGAFYTD